MAAEAALALKDLELNSTCSDATQQVRAWAAAANNETRAWVTQLSSTVTQVNSSFSAFIPMALLPTLVDGSLRVWLAPESPTVAAAAHGASLSSWTDISGAGNTLSSGRPPVVQTTGQHTFNGRRTVLFTTSDQNSAASSQYLFTSSFSLSSSAFTAMIVAKIVDTSRAGRVMSGVNNNWLLGWHAGNMNSYYFAGPAVFYGSPNTPADSSIWLFTGTSSGPGGISRLYRNGVLLGSGSASLYGVAGPAGLCLGGANNVATSGTEFSSVAIAEVLVYGSELGAAARQTMEEYLRVKYAIW
eukprot:m.135281 g.135281  ORF g.135281 m.135281 type:complete len:300 (+) comp14865_c1_seq1:1-900(+)